MNKKAQIKFFVVFIFLLIILTAFVLSADQDLKELEKFEDKSKVSKQKFYDEESKEVLIKEKKLLGKDEDLVKIKLSTPLTFKVQMGNDRKVFEQEVCLYGNYSNFLTSMEYFNVKNNESLERNITLKYLVYENITDIHWTQNCELGKSNESKTPNLICNLENDYNITRRVEKWIDISENKLLEGCYTIGGFTDVYKGDKVEWIPTYLGDIRVPEWAIWEESDVNLQIYWAMEEASGEPKDSAGLDHNYSGSGIANYQQSGKISYAVNFEKGASGAESITLNDDWSVSYWFNSDVHYGNDYTWCTNCASGFNEGMWMTSTSIGWYDGATSNPIVNIPIANDVFHFVAFTKEGTNYTLYLGLSNGTMAISSDAQNDVNIASVGIGHRGDGSWKLNGLIDEFSVYNDTLTYQEVMYLWNDSNGRTYPLTNGSGGGGDTTNPSVGNISWRTTGGFTDDTLNYNQMLEKINVTASDDNNNVTVYLDVIDPDGLKAVNNQSVTNYTNTNFSYTNFVSLNKAGTWTINFTVRDDSGNLNFTSDTITVSIVTQTLRDGWYGYSGNKILNSSEIITLSGYNYQMFEIEENITDTQSNFSLILDSINNSRESNIKAGLNFILDFDYNNSGLKTQYLMDVYENFSNFTETPYTDTIIYTSLELKDQSKYNASIKDAILNDFAENITDKTDNLYVVYSKNYNSSGLDNSYIQYTEMIYLTSSDEPTFIEDQKYHFKNNDSLNRIYEAIPDVVKILAQDFHTRIVDNLRGTPVTTLDDANGSALSNNDVIVFNNGSSAHNFTINVSELSVTGKDIWDSTEGEIIEMNTDDLFIVEVRGYNASVIYFEDLDHIQMDELTEGTLYKGSSTSRLETNHTDGNLDGNFGLSGAYDIQIELYDPHYTQGNFITYYGWINATSINFSSYEVVILADQNNAELDSLCAYAGISETYGYISVADYNNTDVWNDVKNREVDSWLALNDSLNIFVDGLDSGIGGDNFSSRMKDLVDYVQITKGKKGILNTYTAYEEFATWGTGGVMKESCVARWNGASASAPDSYTREDWDLELNKSQWYESHNVKVLCQGFHNRSTDGTFTIFNYTELQNIYFASKVLGYDYFYLSQPDFQYAHEEYLYDLGTDLDRSYHLTGTDLYYRTYSNGIVYYNTTSQQGYFEDGRTMNNLSICFYMYDSWTGETTWNFNINKRDPTGSNGEYSVDTNGINDFQWKWKCTDITDEEPLNGRYLVELWAGDHTVIAGQGGNLGWSSYTGSGIHSWYDTSATDSFTAYPEDQNWMINISVNQSIKASVDTTTKLSQYETNSSQLGLHRNITLNSTKSFPIEIWSKPTIFQTFGKLSYLNSTNSFIELNYTNSSACDSNIPTWALNTIEGNTVKACIENHAGGTLVRVSAPSLSQKIFQLEVNDTTAPTWITIPSNGTVTNATQWSGVTFNATDDFFDNYYVNTSDFTINSTGFLTNASNLDVGFYTILVTVNDSLNNKNYSTYLLEVEEAQVVISITNPTEGQNINTDKFDLVFTTTSSSTCAYSIDGATNISAGSGTSYKIEINSPSDGDHYLNLSCNSSSGSLSNVSSVNFVVYKQGTTNPSSSSSSSTSSSTTEEEEEVNQSQTNQTDQETKSEIPGKREEPKLDKKERSLLIGLGIFVSFIAILVVVLTVNIDSNKKRRKKND